MSRTRKKNQYRQSRAFDKSCRNHGSCSYCQSNRNHKNLKDISTLDEEQMDKPVKKPETYTHVFSVHYLVESDNPNPAGASKGEHAIGFEKKLEEIEGLDVEYVSDYVDTVK